MKFAVLISLLAASAAIATPLPESSNELHCEARGDMACSGLAEKREAFPAPVPESNNELHCEARGDMACTGLSE